jgi:hypothetical protein
LSFSINQAQINSGAKGNEDLRQTLIGISNALTSLYTQTGSGPLTKVDSTTPSTLAPPGQCGLSVSGANGSFTVNITLPQQASGSSKPANATNAPIYQQIQSATAANFTAGLVTYPISTGTSFVFPNPGAMLYWRLRSSYNQQNWNNYTTQPGAVAAGLQTSAASEPNVSLNQSNYCTVDSIAAGGAATVRAYGSGGPGSSWTSILGTTSKVIPGGSVLNVAYGSNLYVAWTGSVYAVKPALTQVFPDGWIPAGKVSVISSGAGLVLPTFHAVVSSGSIVAISTVTAGSGMTAVPTLTITDSSGTGATATCTISGGSVNGVTVTNAGTGYSSSPVVTASGGVAGGVGGGGGPQGVNSGRLYGNTT